MFLSLPAMAAWLATITPGDFDAPPYAAASGVDYAFSPDRKEIAFIRNPDKVEAISTNSDILCCLFERRRAEKHHGPEQRLRCRPDLHHATASPFSTVRR